METYKSVQYSEQEYTGRYVAGGDCLRHLNFTSDLVTRRHDAFSYCVAKNKIVNVPMT